MWHHKRLSTNQSGYTLTELFVVIIVIGIVVIGFYTIFNNTFSQYYYLQRSGMQFADLSSSSQRVANVLRGSTDILAANDQGVIVYAYFYPNNQHVSHIRYYVDPNDKAIKADVTPMTNNPPAGQQVADKRRTYTILKSYRQNGSERLFTYLDSSGASLATPIQDLHTIKGIRINLSTPETETSSDNVTTTLSVSLRNRKTNL